MDSGPIHKKTLFIFRFSLCTTERAFAAVFPTPVGKLNIADSKDYAISSRLKKEGCTGFLPTTADAEKGGVHGVSADDSRRRKRRGARGFCRCADAEKGWVHGVF